MIVRCGLLKRNPAFDPERFADHWLNVHGPIAAGMDNLRAYYQNLVVASQNENPSFGGNVDIDGFSELHFDTYDQMTCGIQSLDAQTGNALLDDAELLLTKRLCDILVMYRHVVCEVPLHMRNKELVHSVSFIKRAKGTTPAEFQREWCYAHAKLVEACPGVVGYSQNVVIDRFVDGVGSCYDKLPVDGVGELYFESPEARDCFFSSSEYKRAAEHGKQFADGVDTFLVKRFAVVDGSASPGYWM